MIAYLDIETSFEERLTVVGIRRPDTGLVQLYGEAITRSSVAAELARTDTICTFNGNSFDLPVLHRQLGLDLLFDYRSLDLHAECKRLGIRGGLKAIELSMSIPRQVTGVNGYDAMVLWRRYEAGEPEALRTLLDYNADDVDNLVRLERRLSGDLSDPAPAGRRVIGPCPG